MSSGISEIIRPAVEVLPTWSIFVAFGLAILGAIDYLRSLPSDNTQVSEDD